MDEICDSIDEASAEFGRNAAAFKARLGLLRR